MAERGYDEKCPLCGSLAKKNRYDGRDAWVYDCLNCGRFAVSRTAEVSLKQPLDKLSGAKASYAIRRLQGGEKIPELDSKSISKLIEETELPRPNEQLELLLRELGDRSGVLAAKVGVEYLNFRAVVGAADAEAIQFLLNGLQDLGLVEIIGSTSTESAVTLTLLGWAKYDEIQKSLVCSSEVFMAMQYGDEAVDLAYRKFHEAVTLTGFDLWRLDERPEAGLIDNRMIVAIRNAKFLIADLTHRNPGAYWEAGMAHGLGKHVIYTWRHGETSHFDTNHYQAVIWKEDELDKAAEDLKAAIRATFPYEARMED